jgi:methionine synthase I (cobalamin-dependent)
MVESLQDADGLLLETQSDIRFLEMVVKTAGAGPRRSALPVLFSFTFLHSSEGKLVTWEGLGPEECARLVAAYPVAALGVNCGREIAMDDAIEIARRYRCETDLPLFARPNAGTPVVEGDRWVFPRTAEQMARSLPELVKTGLCMVGGCCGTSPEYIGALRAITERPR